MCSILLRVSTRKFIAISRPFSVACQLIPECSILSYSKAAAEGESKAIDKALKILDQIIPKGGSVGRGNGCHHRLIQSCMQDLLETGHRECSELGDKTMRSNFLQVSSDKILYSDVIWRRDLSSEEDVLLLFLELHKRGISPDQSIVSSIINIGAFDIGVQIHTFTIKVGLDKVIQVGNSLISFYLKHKILENAYRVFENMTMKNTVSWTALIASYAQHLQVDTCIYLFILMTRSKSKPNDFTFASLLSACTSDASLGLGRSLHSLEIRMGFDSYVHVSNSLISMYAKCGSIEEACYVFEKMAFKDHISWNSMIFGCAQYGLAEQALHLLKEMDEQNLSPDAISYLGVLSSCRHAGLVEEGRRCFSSMLERGIEPELDHYSCVIDLLGRSGLLQEALDFIENMPVPPNAVIWGSLLSSCRVHGNVWLGIQAAENRLLLEPSCAATHVQLVNLYARVGCWNGVAKVRKLMKDRGLKTSPGCSWIEIGNKIYRFKAEDRSNTLVNEVIGTLDGLVDHLKCLGSLSHVNLEFHNWEAYS